MKKIFTLITALTLCVGLWGSEPIEMDKTFDFTKNLYGHKGVSSGSGDSYVSDGDIAVGEKFNEDPAQIEFTVNGSTQTRFWDASSKHELRLYKGATFDLSVVGDYKIIKVEFTGSAVNLEGNGVTVSNKVWEGDAVKSVKFVNTNTTSKINSIKVTYIAADPAAENPTITADTLATVYWKRITVTLACETEGADIYYTLDGSEPTASATKYTAPFSMSATTTVKAIAIKSGLDNSEVVSKTFTFGTFFTSLEELVEKQPATEDVAYVQVTITDAVIDSFYVSSKGYINGVYVTAANTVVELYTNDVPETWKAGGKVSGTIKAEWLLYKGVPELQKWEGGWPKFTYTAPAPKYTEYENWQIKYGNTWEWSGNMEKVEEGLFKLEILWEGTGFNVKSDDNPIKKDWFALEELVLGEEVIAPVTVDVYLQVIDDETVMIGVGVIPVTDPVWPEDAPTTAPVAPTVDGASILGAALTTSYAFEPLDWPGAMPQLLTFETGETIYYMEKMTWQIYTNWDENSYDMSKYNMLHVDLYPATGTEVKVAFEALDVDGGGSGYRNAVVKTLTAGQWNGLDIALSEFPALASGDPYDFSDIKYFVLEGYNAEQSALTVGNVYFYSNPTASGPTVDETGITVNGRKYGFPVRLVKEVK